MNIDKKTIGLLILRLTLAFVFLWFGFSQWSDAALWVSFVPTWMTNIINAGTLVYLNGTFEIIAGIMLALGILPRLVAALLGLHLLFISLSIGLTSATGVRDIGLALATISLSLIGTDPFVLFCKGGTITTE